MKTLRFYCAVGSPKLRLDFCEEIPAKVSSRIEAKNLLDALEVHLPGSVLDQLLAELCSRRALRIRGPVYCPEATGMAAPGDGGQGA